MRIVDCDGSPEAVAVLGEALAAALAGGPAVLPVPPGHPPPGAGPGPGPGAALVIETSGSTGRAKRVVLSAAALRASAQATHHRLGGAGRWLLALPAEHIAGAQVIVRALLGGHRPSVLDLRGGFRPDRFARAAAGLLGEGGGQRRYTSLVPTQLHRILTGGAENQAANRAALEALRGFDAVLIGGAAIPATLRAEALAAGIALVCTYGMSETAGGCVYDGIALQGARVRLDPGDGRISLSGPMLTSGYLGEPEATARVLREGWFHTSDIGRIEPDGRLRVLGRIDDVIITGGHKVHPAAVERVLTAQPGIRAACVVGLTDPEWGQLVAAAVVCDPTSLNQDSPPGAAGLDGAIRAELGPASVPRLLRQLPELPLRGIGKPDRAAVAKLLAAERGEAGQSLAGTTT
jgi:O-succinylbenzoic acid--CoA ligase